jgi:hypothetical protein
MAYYNIKHVYFLERILAERDLFAFSFDNQLRGVKSGWLAILSFGKLGKNILIRKIFYLYPAH